ncbi:hypothetical protein O3P69_001066 [Scylla paramamosain]|uniref:Uncharacterized protein n=1 Tax=Scylla paramamosain TaxID=85552 RepID=A0AAW0UNG3_SCYPA
MKDKRESQFGRLVVRNSTAKYERFSIEIFQNEEETAGLDNSCLPSAGAQLIEGHHLQSTKDSSTIWKEDHQNTTKRSRFFCPSLDLERPQPVRECSLVS